MCYECSRGSRLRQRYRPPSEEMELAMIVGVPQETFPEERRVALVPAVVPMLAKAGIEVLIESGAGEAGPYG